MLFCDFCGQEVTTLSRFRLLYTRTGTQFRWCGGCPRPRVPVPLFDAPPISMN